MDGVDAETRNLCERASARLSRQQETRHACTA